MIAWRLLTVGPDGEIIRCDDDSHGGCELQRNSVVKLDIDAAG